MDELEISGKRYISARRAAKENKYTPDYIGQLIRGQKIIGKKVGRAWYVDEASLKSYLRGEDLVFVEPSSAAAPTLQPVEGRGPDSRHSDRDRQDVGVEDQGATPSIEEEPLAAEETKKEEEVPVVEEVQEPAPVVEKVAPAIEEVVEEKIEQKAEDVFVPVVRALEREVEEVEPEEKEASVGLRFVSEDIHELPVLQKNYEEKSVASSIYIESAMEESEQVEKPKPTRKRGAWSLAALGLVGVMVLLGSAALSSRLVARVEVQDGSPATVAWILE